MEVFKPIKGYDKYVVGNCGTVISYKQKKPRTLQQYLDSQHRYYIVGLSNGHGRKHFLVHRLVCEAFHGEPPVGYVVNHKDHNTKNNSSDNLEWVTVQENVHHSYTTMSPARNKRKCRLIVPEGQDIYFNSCADMAKYCNVNKLKCSSKSLIRHGKSKAYKLELL